MLNLKKVVLTGGPGSGKTTALSRVSEKLEDLGYRVVLVEEEATKRIMGGLRPWDEGVKSYDFQLMMMKLQISKEDAIEEFIRSTYDGNVVMICDRGCLDQKAYVTAEEFDRIEEVLGVSDVALMDRYDAIFQLETAAKNSNYTTENNPARKEAPEVAIALDDRCLQAQLGHEHLRVIKAEEFVDVKIEKLLKEVYGVLGMPEAVEIEDKYLVKMPNISMLKKKFGCREVEIEQIYLASDGNKEIRIRKRTIDGESSYSYTIKDNCDGKVRLKSQRAISKAQYEEFKEFADPHRREIRKKRYCFVYREQYFELDVFDQWEDQAILEIEIPSVEGKVDFPDVIEVIRDVTNDKRYRNYNIAIKGN